ncbi:unnamed protein product [Mucor circinelloides]|uniref:Uncharacterized protein n=1 Tax=Mucor circinelloides f. circinelloides (strain 1006PhL) TaxID=1220926 RepID=S2JXM0_MUCC1|nr:hypothetical protein HMPREF1544_08612 [Mucor circinelloides 1006PhL]
MLKSLTNIGVCVSVVFGTAATFIGHKQNQPLRYTAASIVALIGIRGLLAKSSARSQLSPLQHLKVLNYQPRSISNSISPPTPRYVHSRCI